MNQKKKPSKKSSAKQRDGTEIAYQNKDIISKIFGESLKGKSLSVYGISNPLITDVEPTNLPAVEANELRLDNLFLMEDDAYAIVDYESRYAEENKVKYLGYIARVSKRLYTEYGCYRKLRFIVIYTADVLPGSTNPELDLGVFKMKIEEAFLRGVDSKAIKNSLTDKIIRREPLTEEDVMNLVIYPLTYKGRKAQQRAVTEAIGIAEKILNESLRRMALSGIFVFADKIITEEDADHIKRRISMTKIGRLLEEEYQEREDKAVSKAKKEARKEAKKDKQESALKLLRTGDSVAKVAECLSLPLKEVQALAAKI
ncbi:MAG: hypothetical protein IJ641_01990 [Lachnospiraceae bacterium]|nr:hypothetical protein [Lachnospiraceae bacterium]